MTLTIPVRCRCGALRGSLAEVGPGKHAVCYCDDCQIYALQLGRADTLDERGGSEALMAAPAQLTLTQGAEALRCLRLKPKGLWRWYAGCCNTPLANTLGPRLPIMIVLLTSLDLQALGRSADDALGPRVVALHGRFAKGGVPPGVHPKAPLAALPRMLGHVLSGLLKGRSRPSPFFDARGKPRAPATLIERAQRESLRSEILERAQV